MTSRLKTSQYREFSLFVSISLSLKKIGLKKVYVSVSKKFGLKQSLGIGLEHFGLKKGSVLFSKDLVSKSLGIGLKSLVSKKFGISHISR